MSWIDKEKDEESGDHNFGVRQYDDGLGRFPTIDPFWEKYPSLSPYHYGANNPLLYVDPSGQVIKITYYEQTGENEYKVREVTYRNGKAYNSNGKEYTGNSQFVKEVVGYLNDLKATGHIDISPRLAHLEKSNHVHTIHEDTHHDDQTNTSKPDDETQAMAGVKMGSNIPFNPQVSKDKGYHPATVLAHELLSHSYGYDKGITNWDNLPSGLAKREVHAVNIENVVNAIFGFPKRTTYEDTNGKVYQIPAKLLWDTHRRSKK